MAAEWFSCKGACSLSDPVADTVKVDVSKLASGKENVQPVQAQGKAEQVRKEEEEEEAEKQRAREELQRQKHKEAEDRCRADEQARQRREEEEVARHRREQAAAVRAAAEAAALAKAHEVQLKKEAQKAAEEKARQECEAAELMEAQRREEERLTQEKVNSWCKANGFSDMNSQKKSFMSGSRFPLHEAVAKKNEEMVGLIVQLGVDKGLKNSKGQTAQDLARKMNKAGSMEGILEKLSAS